MKKNGSFFKTAALLAALQALAPLAAGAGVPLKINFQGRLAESGLPAEGSKTFVFKIYDASSGGNLLWTSQSQALTLTQGVFSAALSAGTPADLSTGTFSGARYVEMVVNSVVLAPRQEMVSAPYALVAQALAPDAKIITPITTVTADYTIADGDGTILADATANDVTVTLPAAAVSAGRTYTVKRMDGAAGLPSVWIDSAGGTIDGSATIELTGQYFFFVFQSDGAQWVRIGGAI